MQLCKKKCKHLHFLKKVWKIYEQIVNEVVRMLMKITKMDDFVYKNTTKKEE